MNLLFSPPGWFVIPDLPAHRSAWYLTDKQKSHAIERLGKARKHTWDATVFRRVLLSWQFWLLPFIFMRTFFPLLFFLLGFTLETRQRCRYHTRPSEPAFPEVCA